MSHYILQFKDISLSDLPKVGGKNASLGEMLRALSAAQVNIPEGFAVTAEAYRYFLAHNDLIQPLENALSSLDKKGLSNLHEVGTACRGLIAAGQIPQDLAGEIITAYRGMQAGGPGELSVAVRSSATAEDLPNASFAGQHDSFLNISGEEALLKAVHNCFVSLFNDRAIKYREDNGFAHMNVFLSVGVQRMIRSDKASAGVAFTLEPESGNTNFIYITGAWGLGEAIVQGAVTPDEYFYFKHALRSGKKSLVKKRAGSKANMMVYGEGPHTPVILADTPPELRERFVLEDKEAARLATWCLAIEGHYGRPMDIEWAKDGIDGKLYILQARPETVHTEKSSIVVKEYKLKTGIPPVCSGMAVGSSVVSGTARIVTSLADAGKVQAGDIIIADITSPDWNALLKRAVSIVTNKGGRTSHASIVARELGIPAVVGTRDATEKITDGQQITVSCAQSKGQVFPGAIPWVVNEWHTEHLAETHTVPMFILADPDKAMQLSMYPNGGVGLMRMEFVINNSIKVHPMALVKFDELPETEDRHTINELCKGYTRKNDFFVDKLSEAIAMVAAAFYPKDVIVRMSDFKTNEYARLLGGKNFEPGEENPMLGFRGASRYYHPLYKEAFGLECATIKKVRDEMGLENVKVMIPFCRTVEEGRKVLDSMSGYGLQRGANGLEVYVMAEIPSNVLLVEEFAEIFDGFSIGSNDLTQLTLGIDRDSATISGLFDENNEAVKKMLRQVIAGAKKAGRKIGLCGQAPSDFPEFSKFLVEQGIDSISFDPDALARGIENIIIAEKNK